MKTSPSRIWERKAVNYVSPPLVQWATLSETYIKSPPYPLQSQRASCSSGVGDPSTSRLVWPSDLWCWNCTWWDPHRFSRRYHMRSIATEWRLDASAPLCRFSFQFLKVFIICGSESYSTGTIHNHFSRQTKSYDGKFESWPILRIEMTSRTAWQLIGS